jgi:hypothetical protein
MRAISERDLVVVIPDKKISTECTEHTEKEASCAAQADAYSIGEALPITSPVGEVASEAAGEVIHSLSVAGPSDIQHPHCEEWSHN